jgi:hypothetical protein
MLLDEDDETTLIDKLVDFNGVPRESQPRFTASRPGSRRGSVSGVNNHLVTGNVSTLDNETIKLRMKVAELQTQVGELKVQIKLLQEFSTELGNAQVGMNRLLGEYTGETVDLHSGDRLVTTPTKPGCCQCTLF